MNLKVFTFLQWQMDIIIPHIIKGKEFLSKQANVSTLLSKSFCMEDLFSISFLEGFDVDAGLAALPPLPFLYHTKKKHDMSKQQEETLYLETTSPGSDRN